MSDKEIEVPAIPESLSREEMMDIWRTVQPDDTRDEQRLTVPRPPRRTRAETRAAARAAQHANQVGHREPPTRIDESSYDTDRLDDEIYCHDDLMDALHAKWREEDTRSRELAQMHLSPEEIDEIASTPPEWEQYTTDDPRHQEIYISASNSRLVDVMPDQSCDVIHVAMPRSMAPLVLGLENLCRLLKPGGKIHYIERYQEVENAQNKRHG